MKIILTFTLLMIPGVVSYISVTGYSGGEVTIKCKYDGEYTSEKYFCKGQWPLCTERIRTDEEYRWVHDGRFSLYDDTVSAVFTVTIRDLREEDSGMYWCGTDISFDYDSLTEVNLNVITDTSDNTSVFSAPSVLIPVVLGALSILGGLIKLLCKCRRNSSRE